MVKLKYETRRDCSSSLDYDDAVSYKNTRAIIFAQIIFINEFGTFSNVDVFVDNGAFDGAIFFDDELIGKAVRVAIG